MCKCSNNILLNALHPSVDTDYGHIVDKYSRRCGYVGSERVVTSRALKIKVR